jgi:hypothetical protein
LYSHVMIKDMVVAGQSKNAMLDFECIIYHMSILILV